MALRESLKELVEGGLVSLSQSWLGVISSSLDEPDPFDEGI